MPRNAIAEVAEVSVPEVVAEVSMNMIERGLDVPFYVAAKACGRVSQLIQQFANDFPDGNFVITIAKK